MGSHLRRFTKLNYSMLTWIILYHGLIIDIILSKLAKVIAVSKKCSVYVPTSVLTDAACSLFPLGLQYHTISQSQCKEHKYHFDPEFTGMPE